MNVRFVLRQLIYTAKWKFDYPIFRPVKKKKKRIIVTILNVNPCLDVLMYLKELTIAQLAMIFGLLQVKRIKTWGWEMIRLDLDLAIPERAYGWFAGRSGLALNHGIIVHNETIELGGELGVILFNHSNKEYCKDWSLYCWIDYSVIHYNKVWFSHHIYKAQQGEGK